MKWFKHLSHSLDDQFICELMDEFGSDGYLAFFGILEILADEFNVEKPGEVTLTWRYLRRKTRLSTQKLKKILKYCEDSCIFIVNIRERDVNIKSLKFSDICDEYTQRLLKKDGATGVGRISGHSRDKLRVEVEEEVKDIKDIQILQFVLRDNSQFELGIEKIKQYQITYPNIEVMQYLRECRQWNIDNPDRRKTKKGILKHINTWLGKAQKDRGYVASAQILDEVEPDTRTPEEQKAGMDKFRKFAGGLKLKGVD